MENLDERMRRVVDSKIPNIQKFRELQRISNDTIAANNWKNWYHGKQRPTVQMIEFVCKKYPEMAFWISVGVLPPTTITHSSPKKLQQENEWNSFDFLRLAKTEPLEWSENEAEFMSKRALLNSIKAKISPNATYCLIGAQREGILVEDYVKKEFQSLESQLTNFDSIQRQATERNCDVEIIEYEITEAMRSFEKGVNDLEKILDKKIRR
jgi:hypothetical protein